MGHDMPDILHSTSFLLVDQTGTIRKIFALDEPELPKMVVDYSKQLISEG